MNRRDDRYIPPLRFHWLTRFYDAIVGLTTRERTFRRALLAQAAPRPGHEVLDLGCGTGTFAIMLATSYPDARVTGVDADSDALSIARRKMHHAGAKVRFEREFSTRMWFADASFDQVVSSLFFHHLRAEEKSATLAEVRRVLKPGGEVHVADWGKPAGVLMRAAFLAVQVLDGFETTGDCVRGRLPEMMTAAGLTNARQTGAINTPLGTIALYQAGKPQ